MENAQKRHVDVTVDSDREPVITDGYITERDDSFTLEFNIGKDTYLIEHTPAATRIKADGIMSYDVWVCPEGSTTLLATPYGNVRFVITERFRNALKLEVGWDISLQYVMSSPTAGDMEREVDILVRY